MEDLYTVTFMHGVDDDFWTDTAIGKRAGLR